MAVTNQNHQMFAGETKSIAVTVTNEATGALVDFTAATVTWRIKRGSTTILSKTVGAGITVGTLTIALATGDSTSLSGNYSHELRATLADGTVTTLFTGMLFVLTTEIP